MVDIGQKATDALRESERTTDLGQGLQGRLDAILVDLYHVLDYDDAMLSLLTEQGWHTAAERGLAPKLNPGRLNSLMHDEKLARMKETRS